MIAVYKRELKAYFTGMMGYIFIAFILLMFGIFSWVIHLNGGYPKFEYTVSVANILYLIAVPILTMRVFAEERKQKTDQLLYSLPIRVTDMVLGKYLAVVTLLAVPLAIVALYPLIFSAFGTVALKTAYSALFGFFLMGCGLLAIGLFMSSLTENQIIAAVLSLGVLLLCYFMPNIKELASGSARDSLLSLSVLVIALGVVVWLMTKDWIVALAAAVIVEVCLYILYSLNPSQLNGVFSAGLGELAIFARLGNFTQNGIFDITSLIYFLSITVLFVFFAIQSVEKRRWS